jgi:hypothetical protein
MSIMSKNRSPKKVVWVEKMTAVSLIILITRQLFFDVEIRYDVLQCSRLSKKMLSALNKFYPNSRVIPTKLKLGKNPKGCTLRYDVNRSLAICLENFCKKYIPDEAVWFKQMIKSYLASVLHNRIVFIAIVESEAGFLPDTNHELFLDRLPVNTLITSFYRERGFKIRQSLNLLWYVRMIVLPFRYLILTLISQIFGQKAKSNFSKIKPAIWGEYHREEIAGFLSLFFWHKSIRATELDLVYYLDRADTPLSEELEALFSAEGFHWIDCHRIWRLSRLTFDDVRDFLFQATKINFKHPFWLHFFRLEFSILYKLFLSVYSRFKVKILIQHQEASWKQAVQAKAIESSGGIMVGFHWSNYLWTNIVSHLNHQHVFFVWGDMYYEHLQKKGNTCQYILPSGMWITKSNKKPEWLKDFSEEISYKLAIFDSSVGYRIQNSPDSLSQFYFMIIELLENHPYWGGIVKSKYRGNLAGLGFLPDGEKIAARLKKLHEKKRLVVLDVMTSPVTAAASADLAVCYGLNSAGIIAGIYGVRTIHWDCAGWLKYPIYRDHNQKIVYPSLDEFQRSIIDASQGDHSIGDFSRWRQKCNYFDDAKAPERVADFIQDFMQEVIRTDDARHSLDLAVQNYIEKNNVEEEFFTSDDLWGDK